MKNILYTIILSFLFSFGVFADWEEGLDVYIAGDYVTAFREFKTLAEQGDAMAQFNLGYMYYQGEGVTQDNKEAVKWFRLAAEQGDAEAQNSLGWMYKYGKGVTQDHKEAVKWFRLATEQGDATAQYNLGVVYANGRGVIQDLVIAHMWLNIAASNGYEDAKTNRDIAESMMTQEQIVKAEKLARECIEKNYKDCG